MKFYCLNGLISVALSLIISCGNQAYSQESHDKVELTVIEQKLVQDALKNINTQLNNKKGSLERISCRYKIAGDNPLSASIKTFYVDYRKSVDCLQYDFKKAAKLAQCGPDQIIEIIYKSHEKNQLTVVNKTNHKRRSCKYVSIS